MRRSAPLETRSRRTALDHAARRQRTTRSERGRCRRRTFTHGGAGRRADARRSPTASSAMVLTTRPAVDGVAVVDRPIARPPASLESRDRRVRVIFDRGRPRRRRASALGRSRRRRSSASSPAASASSSSVVDRQRRAMSLGLDSPGSTMCVDSTVVRPGAVDRRAGERGDALDHGDDQRRRKVSRLRRIVATRASDGRPRRRQPLVDAPQSSVTGPAPLPQSWSGDVVRRRTPAPAPRPAASALRRGRRLVRPRSPRSRR